MKLLGQDINPARDVTLERFRRTFYGGSLMYPTVDKLLEHKEEDVKGRGILLSKEGGIGLIVNPTTWLEGFIEQYGDQEWRGLNLYPAMLEEMNNSFNALILNDETYSPSRIKDCIDVMDLWGKDENGTPLLMIVSGKERPLLLRGMGGEVMMLAPVLAMENQSKTKAWYEDEVIARVKARYKAMEDPDKVWFENKDGKEIILDVAELKSIHHTYLGYELHIGDDKAIMISEETANRLRSEYKLRLYSRVRKYDVNDPVLKEAFFEAWLKNDPSFTHKDEFEEALANLSDYIKDNGHLPCSLIFWAQHWNEQPPATMSKYRSMYTASEWARAITEIALLGNVHYFKILPSKDRDGNFSKAAITIHVNNLDDEVLMGLDLVVNPATYKAKHLLKYRSDVQHFREGAGNSPYAWWELTEDLMDFERLYVLPPEVPAEWIEK